MSLKDFLKKMCPHLFDEPRILLIKGRPGAGKTAFCIALAHMWIKEGKSVVYLTTEQPPNEIEESVGKIKVVDGFSWRLGSGIDIRNLSFLSYRIKQVIAEMEKDDMFIFDSGTSLTLYNDPLNVAKFFEILVARLRKKGVWGILVVESGIEERLIHLLERFVDCIFELEKDGKRTIRIAGTKFLVCSLDKFEIDFSELE